MLGPRACGRSLKAGPGVWRQQGRLSARSTGRRWSSCPQTRTALRPPCPGLLSLPALLARPHHCNAMVGASIKPFPPPWQVAVEREQAHVGVAFHDREGGIIILEGLLLQRARHDSLRPSEIIRRPSPGCAQREHFGRDRCCRQREKPRFSALSASFVGRRPQRVKPDERSRGLASRRCPRPGMSRRWMTPVRDHGWEQRRIEPLGRPH